MRFNAEEQIGACGILNLYAFSNFYGDYIGNIRKAGSGLYIANFINRDLCKQAYQELNKKYKLLYQSPVSYNKNSGNQGFFCVFGDKDRF